MRENENPDLQNWYDQLERFDQMSLLKHKDSIESFNKLLIEEKVVVTTLTEITNSHQYHGVDLIDIDNEVHNLKNLKSYPFKFRNPTTILFERKHLSKIDYLVA